MMWEKTDCRNYHQTASCPEMTKFFINYCGSQREAMKEKLHNARQDCLSRRGQHYLRIRINGDTLPQARMAAV